MERHNNDFMQLKDTMKQGVAITHGEQERLQRQMEDDKQAQERCCLTFGDPEPPGQRGGGLEPKIC